VSELDPDLPQGLSDLVERLMAKRPEKRPESARAVIETLDQIEKAPRPAPRKRTTAAKAGRRDEGEDERTEKRDRPKERDREATIKDEDTERPGKKKRRARASSKSRALMPALIFGSIAGVAVLVTVVAMLIKWANPTTSTTKGGGTGDEKKADPIASGDPKDKKTGGKDPDSTDPGKLPGVFTLMFKGDWTGWEGLKPYWSVNGSGVTGSTVSAGGIKFNTFLCSTRNYKDFELTFQVRLKGPKANSGVQVRSRLVDRGTFKVIGPQVDMGEGYWGSLYGEGLKGMMKAAPQDKVRQVLKQDDFNDFLVRCVGKHVLIVLNGLTTVDDDFDDLPPEGIIAWQIHAGPGMEATFRDVRIRELAQPAESGWVSLFNGQNLNGWKTHPSAPGNWKVENGNLVGRGPKMNYLFTEKNDHKNFHFRVEAKINLKANSGQLFRCNFKPGVPDGYQAQIDSGSHPAKTGSLYINVTPKIPIKEVLVPPDTWFTQEVIADGNHIVIKVNDKVTVDFKDDAFTFKEGHLALEVVDPTTEVHFRKIEVKRLPDTPAPPADFVSLFDGISLAGWEYLGGGDCKAVGGVLRLQGDATKRPGWLASQRDYDNFELELEYRLSPKGNSGVFVHAWKEGVLIGAQFLEIQLIDDDGYGTVGKLNGTASIYGVLAPKMVPGPAGKAVPVKSIPNTWHKLGIRAQGRRLQVFFEGTEVINTNLDEHAAAFKRFPGLQRTTGRIGLQQHTGTVEFRNIRLRVLSK
jgi:hypothetical protein